MSKVTGKFQITLPKRLAEAHGIKVGDELDIVDAGSHLSLKPARQKAQARPTIAERLRHFDDATERQRKRQRAIAQGSPRDRGWKREELYQRGRSD